MSAHDDVIKTADLSDDGVYRYSLTRQWDDRPFVCWIMLNPSTADADIDDPTIRRCMGFARRWDAGGIRVVNLFAYRATDPKALARFANPIGGTENRTAICRAINAEDTSIILAGWGASNPYPAVSTITLVKRAAAINERNVECLGFTRTGSPRHPLYIKGDQPRVSYFEGGA